MSLENKRCVPLPHFGIWETRRWITPKIEKTNGTNNRVMTRGTVSILLTSYTRFSCYSLTMLVSGRLSNVTFTLVFHIWMNLIHINFYYTWTRWSIKTWVIPLLFGFAFSSDVTISAYVLHVRLFLHCLCSDVFAVESWGDYNLWVDSRSRSNKHNILHWTVACYLCSGKDHYWSVLSNAWSESWHCSWWINMGYLSELQSGSTGWS